MGTAFFSSLESGRKWLTCPHCHRWFEVDIDDILPVHGKDAVIVFGHDMKAHTENRGDLCDGSWVVKGVPAQFVLVEGIKKPNATD